MTTIPRISSSITEPWVAWTMLLLLIILGITSILQRGLLVNSFRALRSAKERDNMFNITLTNPLGQIFLYTYKINILALTMYTLLPHQDFCFTHFLLLVALFIVFFIAKYLIARLLAYTFFSPRILQTVMHHYTGLTTCCTILLYPILLFALFAPLPTPIPLWIICGCVLVFYAIILTTKIFQFFFTQPLASVHIFLYLCTLEALPLVGLFYVGYELIN